MRIPLRWMVPAFLVLLPPFVDSMTAINNLALMLSETLSQMQQQQAECKKPGNGACKKPGAGKGKGKKPSLSQVKKMQEELSKNMKKAKEQMEKQGNKPGQNHKPGQDGMGSSEELASRTQR